MSRDVDLGSAKMTPAECMGVVRRNPLCDHEYFNLGADGKCSCVGPTTDCSDKKYQKTGDGAVYKIITGKPCVNLLIYEYTEREQTET